MRKIFLYLISFFLFISSYGQKLGLDKLNLEKFDFDLNIESFYSEEIKKGDLFTEQRTEIHLKGTKTKEDYGDDLIEFWEYKRISIDSIYKNDTFKSNELIGIQYNMNSWGSNDKLAYYNEMQFHRINMMKSLNGDFIALVSTNESKGKESFKSLLNYLISKNGEPKFLKQNLFGKYYTYSWNLKDKLIVITSKINKQESTIMVGDNIEKKALEVTRLYIVNKKHINSLRGKPNKLDWIYF